MGEKQILAITSLIFLLLFSGAYAEPGAVGSLTVPAVTNEGKGVLTELEIELAPGKGRILFNTEPFTGLQTQNSERVAQLIAQNFTGVNLSDRDVIITFKVPAISIDGPSAGAAMTILLISVIENKTLRNDTTLSGTIQPDGTVGPVGGIFEKAEAAHSLGFKYFLVPRNQEIVEQNVDEEFSPSAGQTAIRTIVRSRNITRYAEENWNMTVIPVSDVKDLHEIFIEGKTSVTPRLIAAPAFPLSKAEITPSIDVFEPIAKSQIENATKTLDEAAKAYSRSKINNKILADIADLIDESKRELDKANFAYENNYLYGAANHAFRSRVFSKTAVDALEFYSLMSPADRNAFLLKRRAEVFLTYNETRRFFEEFNSYSNNTGSYEWISSGQSRFSQAEEQLSALSPTEGSLYELALAEGWLGIGTQLFGTGIKSSSNAAFDASVFRAQSETSIRSLDKTLSGYTQEPPSGVSWLFKASQREYSHGWFVSAYVDSEIAHKRIEAGRDLSIQGFQNYTDFVQEKIDAIAVGTSPWAKLYKDQAILTLYYAKRDQDFSALNTALVFANEAKIYADLEKTVRALPTGTHMGIKGVPIEYVLSAVFALGLIIVGIYYWMTRDVEPEKRYLHK